MMMRRTPLALVTVTALTLAGSAMAAPVQIQATYTVQHYDQELATGLIHSQDSQMFSESAPRQATQDYHVVPRSYSLRGVAGPVENQGACGSCWSFSLTSALRGTYITAGRDPGRLSFNYLLNCDTQMYGCGGGSFSAASYLNAPRGAPQYGSDGAYIARQGACVRRSPVASSISYHMLGNSSNGPSFRDIAYVVGVLHRPVSIDVMADTSWKNYRGGVYNGCTSDNSRQTNHMVVIEGYSCEGAVDSRGNCKFDANGNLPAGVGTWLIRNSWGPTWGDHGYITTKATDRYGRRCNAVASEALYFDVNAGRTNVNSVPNMNASFHVNQ